MRSAVLMADPIRTKIFFLCLLRLLKISCNPVLINKSKYDYN